VTGSSPRDLPSVDRLLRDPRLAQLPRGLALQAGRDVLDEARHAALNGAWVQSADDLPRLVQQRVQRLTAPQLRPVLNATGVVIHTNLGRAPLSRAALEAAQAAALGYSNLEYDLEAGERGSRHTLVTDLLRRLTGAEDALVTNNNAAAVLLILSALGQGSEAIISRGQLVEIGGGFRIPDVMRQSGVKLVEVGTTNRTYAADFEAAITDHTGLLLRVHASNFQQIGFVHQPSLQELVDVGRRYQRVVADDLGSGSLLDTSRFGLAKEPMVQASVAAGVTLVAFSGDKLLGGPQAGIVVGRSDQIAGLRRLPLMRAIRPDKLTLAALAFQVAVGAVVVTLHLPAALRGLHLALASAVWAGTVVLAVIAARLPATGAPAGLIDHGRRTARPAREVVLDYVSLAKPRIIPLLLITASIIVT